MPHPNSIASLKALQNCCVIYFGNDWFAENRTSSHHIARRLSALVPVLYVESPGSRAPQTNVRDFRKLWRKLASAIAPARKIHDRLYVKTVPQIPFRRLPLMNRINGFISEWLLRREIRRLGFTRWLSWFLVPYPAALAKRLNEVLTVYYCTDDYAAHPGMDAVAIQALDDHVTRCADIVFVVPIGLLEAKRAINPNVRYSPHGVDFDLFSQASDPATVTPELVRELRHPIIGYFGTVGEWMDFDLVMFLARSRPQWTFLFVGFNATDTTALRAFPNIVLAGPRPYEELPRWARAFDVAINPHRVNRQVRNANSLKLREYLATGKPVVSVTTPESSGFSGVMNLADTPEDFLQAIDQALAADSPELRAKRMEAVKPLSWDARFRETVEAIEKLLQQAPVS
jgi:glycosyltransferase involved in cell wall biosynthesis